MLIKSVFISAFLTGMALVGVSTASADPLSEEIEYHTVRTSETTDFDEKFLFIGHDMDGDAQYLVVTAEDLED
jgi:hypothetical protein